MAPQLRFEADVPSTHDQPWATVEPVREAPRYVLLVVTKEYAKPSRPDESATPVVCQCGVPEVKQHHGNCHCHHCHSSFSCRTGRRHHDLKPFQVAV
jgi:hypothetical protein